MTNLKKLNKIISNQQSTWEEEAKWRTANEEWLSQSFDVAIRVLDTLRIKKMTQKELAERMNVSPQFINKVLKGQENLTFETIAKLSRALGVKLIQVIGSETLTEIEYDFEQAYQVSELYRQQFFQQASEKGYVGLMSVQSYVKEQKLEYKSQA